MHLLSFSPRRRSTSPLKTMAGYPSTLLSLLVICSTFSVTLAMQTDDRDSDFQDQLYFPLSFNRAGKPSRLSNLLAMKQSLSDNQLSEKNGNVLMNSEDNPQGGVQKRVFCNTYTGCGGDFRRRRVQRRQRRVPRREKKSVGEKRPFCNTYGCYNGRKRTLDDRFPLAELPPYDKATRHIKLPKIGAMDTHSLAKDVVKRLFCNNYGGCRNSGKRTSTLPILIGKGNAPLHLTPAETLSLLEDLSEVEPPRQDKRFFAGGFDNAMENFVNDLKR